MISGRRALRIVKRHADRQARRGDTSMDWNRIKNAVEECDRDDFVEMFTEFELKRAADEAGVGDIMDEPFERVGCINNDDCDCTSDDLLQTAAGLAAAVCPEDDITIASVLEKAQASADDLAIGALGDGKILEALQKFMEWLLSEETLSALLKFIEALVTIFITI